MNLRIELILDKNMNNKQKTFSLSASFKRRCCNTVRLFHFTSCAHKRQQLKPSGSRVWLSVRSKSNQLWTSAQSKNPDNTLFNLSVSWLYIE